LVGRLKGIPGVFSQGQTLAELEENIRDAYQLMNMEAEPAPAEVKTIDDCYRYTLNKRNGNSK
jgi:predicted RNase H-like HicB family nuclease